MSAYYNEHDPRAARWLRELIKDGYIAGGEVDERDIQDVRPDELRGFTQCHFFAGIGGWSLALRIVGWPDSMPVWTGSCPCQPFSSAGEGLGFSDDRHLWPYWQWLIRQCRPRTVFGEQVASAIGKSWLDAVSSDLEAEGYACGPIVLPACSVGAPHIRQRLWFMAHSDIIERALGDGRSHRRSQKTAAGLRATGDLGDACGDGGWRNPGAISSEKSEGSKQRCITRREPHEFELAGAAGFMGDPDRQGRQGERGDDGAQLTPAERAGGATRGFWAGAAWISCRDGKARPIEPGVSPLAHGVPGRVGLLRGYGNAIVPQVAALVIRAGMEDVA